MYRFTIMMKRIMIIGAVLGIFILCAIIVMFIARHDKARSALCMQCHIIKTTVEPWKKINSTMGSNGKIEKIDVFLLTKSSKAF